MSGDNRNTFGHVVLALGIMLWLMSTHFVTQETNKKLERIIEILEQDK